MKRLTLAELKEQSSANVTTNLESVKGGNFDWCHLLATIRQAMHDVADSQGFGPGNHEFR